MRGTIWELLIFSFVDLRCLDVTAAERMEEPERSTLWTSYECVYLVLRLPRVGLELVLLVAAVSAVLGLD